MLGGYYNYPEGGYYHSVTMPRCECHACTQARHPGGYIGSMASPLTIEQKPLEADHITMVPHSMMVSQIEAAVLAERKRCLAIVDEMKADGGKCYTREQMCEEIMTRFSGDR